jgi:hypothetical protein
VIRPVDRPPRLVSGSAGAVSDITL